MKDLMREKNLKFQGGFNKIIGTQRALTRWKSGESTPSLTSCVAIKEAFGKSLDWIILGEESHHLGEHPAEPYEARPLAPIQPALLGDTISMVEETLKDLLRSKKIHKLTEDQKNMLIAKVYAQCAEDLITPDRLLIEKYLLLTD